MGRLEGKNAIITGGTSGIGRDATVRFIKEGAQVLFTGRDQHRADETLAMVEEAGGRAWFVQQDVTREADWLRVMDSAQDKFARLDILINSAGIFFLKSIEETTAAEFQRMWRINVDGVFLGAKYAIAMMRKQGARGSIVNIASLSGLVGHALCSAYCSSKAGTIMLSKAAALDAAPDIRVNVIAPGPVWNELLLRAHGVEQEEEMKAYYKESQPLKTLGASEDVTHAIVFLASDEARYITGAAFRVDAGRGAD